ncbi:hypothetical protein DXG03_003255 [Asterophora parasitica]|uniref:Uncharacterized protein n=1 Tax=Asterophora parasitica TaxID=117018 RepID=A0A9P7GBY3_9AGAR|nr:hypothetical protein DXG03_003255 [Asterophora parasitica]
MAATLGQLHSARFQMNGPSWDEEVVPALRKRLESESRTLAKRMSAISLSSQDNIEHFTSMHAAAAAVESSTPASPFLQSNSSSSAARRVEVRTSDRPRGNGTPKNNPISVAPAPKRSRTYSQPYPPDLPNGNGRSPRLKTNVNKSPRAPQPTRIPQPARSPPSVVLSGSGSSTSTNGSPRIPNGHHKYTSSSTTSHSNPYSHSYSSNTTTTSHTTTQDLNYDQGRRTPVTIPRSGLTNGSANGNIGLGLLNEPPPFNLASASSSIAPSRYSDDRRRKDAPEDPPRPSMESEERPFEHWYRGEVSRNGGVGELRVGRRQEMLEIANYGHTIRALERERREEGRRRKRADSVSGIGGAVNKRERERGSLYLDEVDAGIVGRVLDEAPLTDLEGSEGEQYGGSAFGYGSGYPHEDDDEGPEDMFEQGQDGERAVSPPPAQRPSNDRSTTPTPSIIQQAQAQPRPSSRNTGSVPPSRIPARSRQSSESRVTTPTPSQMIRGASEPLAASASTSTATHSPSPPQTQQRQVSRPTLAGTAVKPKSRTQASKATRAKTLASKKELEEEMKRRSVAYYPTPGGEGDEMMIDAIPEWTQPVPREGNWDDVVLPVVARKKGLDEHYQKADGNPTPRKADTTIAPAPGTFGFDHSKYRPPRADGEPESIAMDEFGRPTPAPEPPSEDQSQQDPNQNSNTQTGGEQTRLPVPSSAPFSDYAPARVEKSALGIGDIEAAARRQEIQQQEKEEEAGGCCKCVIM